MLYYENCLTRLEIHLNHYPGRKQTIGMLPCRLGHIPKPAQWSTLLPIEHPGLGVSQRTPWLPLMNLL